MAQYIEHPALRGMEMGNRASLQRMNIYAQAVAQATEALNKAAAERQNQWYQLQRERDLMKAGINPRSYERTPYAPDTYGLDLEQTLVGQQAAAEGINPQTGRRYQAPQTGAGEVPFAPSAELQGEQRYQAIGPAQMQEITRMPAPQSESILDFFIRSNQQPRKRQKVGRAKIIDPSAPRTP